MNIMFFIFTVIALVFILIFMLNQFRKWEIKFSNLEINIKNFQENIEKRTQEGFRTLSDYFKEVGDRIKSDSKTLMEETQKMKEIVGEIKGKFDSASDIFSRGVEDIKKMTQEISNIFKTTGTKGKLGEWMLEELLLKIIPKNLWAKQFQISGSLRVDYVIKLPSRNPNENMILPIEAKFPSELYIKIKNAQTNYEKEQAIKNFKKGIKKLIEKASSYISLTSQTTDYAFLYLPSDAIWFEAIGDKEILNYAYSKKVLLVSPSTFYLYLQNVRREIEIYEIEKGIKERAQEFQNIIKNLENQSSKVQEAAKKTYTHLQNAIGSLGTLMREITNLKNITAQITLIEPQRKNLFYKS